MSVTQVVRDSTVVEHAKVAAQQKRRMFVVQLRVNTYDEPSSSVRPGLTRILEGIEEAGWRLEQISYTQDGNGEPAQLCVFRPAPDGEAEQKAEGNKAEAEQPHTGQQQPHTPSNTGPVCPAHRARTGGAGQSRQERHGQPKPSDWNKFGNPRR